MAEIKIWSILESLGAGFASFIGSWAYLSICASAIQKGVQIYTTEPLLVVIAYTLVITLFVLGAVLIFLGWHLTVDLFTEGIGHPIFTETEETPQTTIEMDCDETEDANTEEEPQTCQYCGRTIKDPDAENCPRCGAPLS